MTHFWCQFGFQKCFGASFQYNHWGGGCQLSCTIHFSSPVTVWSRNGSLLRTLREHDTSEWFFWFLVNTWGTHLPSFFTFPVCFKCQMTIEWLMLSSSATSVVVRGSASVILSLDCCQFLIPGHYASHFQASRLFAKLLEPPLHCIFISSSWAKCIVDVSCLCYFMAHFELKKIVQIYFFSSIISLDIK